MVMSDEQCEKLFNSIIDTNKKMVGLKSDTQWLKHNAETQVKWCRKNEDRLIELEAWMGRSKGHFKVLGRAVAIIAAAIITVVTILYQRLGGG